MTVDTTPTALTGWGNSQTSVGLVGVPESIDETRALLMSAGPRGAIARGLGRSYGDVAQNAGGTVIDMQRLSRILSLDAEHGLAVVEGGCSLSDLIEAALPSGWFLPVTPGTRFVTVGGAIACDVHGKNHHVDGSFGRHLRAMKLLTPDGMLHELDPETTPGPFWATVGGLGLTGVVVEATIALLRISGPAIVVDVARTRDLDATLARLRETDERYRYSVAWVDATSGGRKLGRSVLIQGDHAEDAAQTNDGATAPFSLSMPRAANAGPFLRSSAVRAFNELYYRRAPDLRRDRVSLWPFFYPLDRIRNWNRLYGRRGFVQYQFVVPLDRGDLIGRALEELQHGDVTVTLTVLKRLGAASPGGLSFPAKGWTVALDFALPAPSAATVLDRLDQQIAEAGGRVYLAKDSRLRAELVDAMYPRLGEWNDERRVLDPEGVLQHDLSRRLELVRA